MTEEKVVLSAQLITRASSTIVRRSDRLFSRTSYESACGWNSTTSKSTAHRPEDMNTYFEIIQPFPHKYIAFEYKVQPAKELRIL